MCGILGIVGNVNSQDVTYAMNRLHARGPDNQIVTSSGNVVMGFTRLAINGTTPGAMQPFRYNRMTAICNGEIFNHKNLELDLDYEPVSGSDCEVLLPGYVRWGFPTLCNKLDAEFAMIMHDSESDLLWIARDPYGVRPLFWGVTPNGTYAFASELKGISEMCDVVNQFNPGWYMCLNTGSNPDLIRYSEYRHTTSYEMCTHMGMNFDFVADMVRDLLISAVRKRLMCEQGGVCCLLSGGLDSSLVSSIANSYSDKTLHTFSIGLKGATDLIAAQKAADYIGSAHTTVELKEDDFLDAIPEVIGAIESYDVTTVRASVGNYLIGKYIKDNTNFKVVLNGDYADEVCGGYLYMKLAPSAEEFQKECQRLVNNIHYFDSLRSDRTICAHGLEARAPYADKEFLEFYMRIHPVMKSPKGEMEKFMLRKAFSGYGFLPDEILWRSKEAFSDGVSTKERSWHTIVSDHVRTLGYRDEEEYYKSIFDSCYGAKHRNVIPYKWMPRFCDATDPSARTLEVYNGTC